LKEQILDIETNNKRLIETYRTQLEAKKQNLQQQNSYLQSMILANKHIKLMKVKKQLTTKLNQISIELDELNPSIKTEYQVKGIDQLQTSVSDLLDQAMIVVKAVGNSFC
jgi:hypothetical protein